MMKGREQKIKQKGRKKKGNIAASRAIDNPKKKRV